MTQPVELRFRGFEEIDRWRLRATFAAVDAEGRAFTAYANLNGRGAILDLQASDTSAGGTTGRPAIDALIARRVETELIRARAVSVVANFDRPRRRGYVA